MKHLMQGMDLFATELANEYVYIDYILFKLPCDSLKIFLRILMKCTSGYLQSGLMCPASFL